MNYLGAKYQNKMGVVVRSIIIMCATIIVFAMLVNYKNAAAAEVGSDDAGVSSEIDVEPKIYIKAINPGYTVDGVSNVGEMIEIGRVGNSDEWISLAGYNFSYKNFSGKTVTLVEFPVHSYMTGETLLLRLASSTDRSLANLTYSKTLAMKAGPLELRYGETVVDTVCWTGGEGCAPAFKSASPTVLVRGGVDGLGGSGSGAGVGAEILKNEFVHVPVDEYEVKFNVESYYVETAPDEDGYGAVAAQCNSMMFSEILSYYAETKDEQFIELYNGGAETVLLDGCQIKYKNKSYVLSGMVKPEEYFVVLPSVLGFNLTKNPNTSNAIELVDVNGEVADTLEYPNGQRKGTAWAWIGYDAVGERLWRTTYAATPGTANNYQEYRTCEEGKVINEATGNCVKVTTVAEKVCGEGKYLNVLTGRCKKIEEASVTTCKDGYYYYEPTGRCRKIVVNDGANYDVTYDATEYEEKSSFVALYAVLGVVALGAVYAVWELRHEIKKVWKKVTERSGRDDRGGSERRAKKSSKRGATKKWED